MRRKRIIALLLILGPFLLVVSTILFTYQIPRVDSAILDLDGKITDADNVYAQFQLIQSSDWVPYNLVKMLDINPNPPPQVKQRLAYYMKIAMMTSLSLLCWPSTPTAQQHATWQAMNFIEMEKVKLDLFRSFSSYRQDLGEQRAENIKNKQSLLLWSTLLQVFALTLTAVATSLQTLRK